MKLAVMVIVLTLVSVSCSSDDPVVIPPDDTPTPLPTDGLVAFYTLDGHAIDSAGGLGDGSIIGAVIAEDRFGHPGKSMSFDGVDDYIRVTDLDVIYDSFAISLWLLADAIPTWYVYPFSIHSGGGGINTGDRNISMLLQSSGSLNSYFSSSDGGTQSGDVTMSIEASIWYHIVYQRDEAGDFELFVNGVSVDTYNGPIDTFSMTNGLLEIGAPNYWSGDWTRNGRADAKWKGRLDQFRIYDRQLTVDEVQDLFKESE